MTVHILIPVFNRLGYTQRVIECLHSQKVDEILRFIVIDDGSTDGTQEFLASQHDITTLKGDGSLWWGGAIEIGLQLVLETGSKSDWILFINNDTQFNDKFVQCLLDVARRHAPAAVGSVICDEMKSSHLLSIGAELDTWRLHVREKLTKNRLWNSANGLHSVDALSGRGTLYPFSAFQIAGTMRPSWIPHYFADYELSVRISKAGFKLLVNEAAVILSADEFGNSYRPTGLREKFFSIRSASYLPAVIAFWWSASSSLERLTLLPRLLFVGLKSRWVIS
jgi:N-acetylglucosaminyl-diphospho-decaprenol L-rhamnosyltransferase